MPIPKIEARSSTMSQRLGFHDPDLTSPEHDAMVFWVKNHLRNKNKEKLIKNLLGPDLLKEDTSHVIEQLDDFIEVIESKIEPKKYLINYNREEHIQEEIKIIRNVQRRLRAINWNEENSKIIEKIKDKGLCKIQLEQPVLTQTKYVIGYIDITFEGYEKIDFIERHCHEISFFDNETKTTDFYRMNIEVKPKIQSFGELVRQINTYRVHNSWPWYVACPDDRHKDNLADENIGFIHITEDYKEYL